MQIQPFCGHMTTGLLDLSTFAFRTIAFVFLCLFPWSLYYCIYVLVTVVFISSDFS